MRIAVASGKGGTGKTTLAIALASCIPSDAMLIDCDVEEPNCHLFSDAAKFESIPVTVMQIEWNSALCLACGACLQACRFHALARLPKRILFFPELCHGCGGCVSSCPTHAMREHPGIIGSIQKRSDSRFEMLSGVMKIGYSMSPPLIRKLKQHIPDRATAILDCPPGTACPMVTAVSGCDYVLLVTEPTPFGLHDLRLAVETLLTLKIPMGVILNRAGTAGENQEMENFCCDRKIPLLLKIPFSRRIAEGYSVGRSLLDSCPELRTGIQEVLNTIGVKP